MPAIAGFSGNRSVRSISRDRKLELLRADVQYHRDRIALLRAKLYRWGLGSSARLQSLERELQRAEQRLRQEREPPSP
jgi:hypothetical protein